MGFNSVFRTLKEVFPQVDVRILKAVSIEHSKDADAAVEFILLEVVPSMSSLPEAPCSLRDNQDVTDPSVGGVQLEEQSFLLEDQQTVHETNAAAASRPNRNIIDTNRANDALYVNSTCLDEALAGSSVLNLYGANDNSDQLSVNTGTEEVIPSTEHQKINVTAGSDRDSHVASSSLIHEDTLVNVKLNGVHADFLDLNERVAYDSNSAVCRETRQEQSCMESNSLQEEISSGTVQFVPSSVHEETTGTAECELLVEKDIGASVSECEKPGPRGASGTASEHEIFATETADIEDETSLTTIVAQSGQICRIDLLEDSIRDAKNNKKILFSAMESIINMMREVEILEKAAEQAKEEAVRGGLDVIARVEDLKQMLPRVKEANDMVHAGEVYGEKAILATEVRELQSRLLNLSDERDKSLAILDEMRQTLEARLAAAEEERKAAEHEKLEKEESARKALAEQELIMEKVVQESKKLQQEAEENTKLQEFVVDRGQIVDILQGEIAVICQDVKLLKEKFDERLPLSKSVSSSQTSCILASSSSSFRSFASDRVPEQAGSSEALKKTSPTPSIDGRSQKGSSEGVRDDCNEPLDDEWDIVPFHNEDVLHA
ncbi:hypothetical protein HHK36_012579 [Tetracentron sinense]|uniref:CUE domain-containing protein n=1 Tax=Tetracentron sinense TaxID=13715 RepID=A0A834ZAL7_TETSI|nr:hypothetical protein HHK36_012579 [Tetracentron sinense]